MKAINVRFPAAGVQPYFDDAKEAMTDALLNLTWQRVSGFGAEGGVVYGTKPSLRFVSGFLLPRFSDHQTDETSDIHISTHGIDCQIGSGAPGTIDVRVDFAIYVRALPSWDELTSGKNELFPSPPLRREIETHVRDVMKDRLLPRCQRS